MAACRATEFRLCGLCVVEPYRFTRGRFCETGLGGAQLDEAPKALPITLLGQTRRVPGGLGLEIQYRERVDRALQPEPSPPNFKPHSLLHRCLASHHPGSLPL